MFSRFSNFHSVCVAGKTSDQYTNQRTVFVQHGISFAPKTDFRMHLAHLHERGKSFAEYSSKISLSVTKMGALLQASTACCCRCVLQ